MRVIIDWKQRWAITYLSITYRVPLVASSVLNPSRGGSSVIETSSSWCLNTGGMSLKDAGVDAISVLCSSGEMNFGSSLIMKIGAIFCVE